MLCTFASITLVNCNEIEHKIQIIFVSSLFTQQFKIIVHESH